MERVAKALAVMAELTNKELSEAAADMLMLDLSEYPEEEVLNALNKCRKELHYFPTVSEIVARIRPEDDPDSLAEITANKIIERVAKDGYTNWERAKENIGPVGVAVVEMQGGWTALCKSLREQDLGQARAQFCRLAKAVQKTGTKVLALPNKPQEKLQSFGDIMSKALEYKK